MNKWSQESSRTRSDPFDVKWENLKDWITIHKFKASTMDFFIISSYGDILASPMFTGIRINVLLLYGC